MTTKKNLANKLSKKLGYLSNKESHEIIDFALEYIKNELVKGNRIEIRGFGSLTLREKKYAGRDDVYNTVYFRASCKNNHSI